MTYNLLLTGELDRPGLASALASLTSLPVDAVDVADVDDPGNRNWDAPVSCTYERVAGDITWVLDIYLAETVTPRPTEPEAAAHVAEKLGSAVLYPAEEPLPSAYWLTAPGGVLTRARVYSIDEDDQTTYRIDAVEQPVPSLPTVPVAAQPEVIREYPMPTPITDEVSAWLATITQETDAGDALWFARTRLGAWERLTSRMTSGWPPGGWYPADLYREDLETRDELAGVVERLPATVVERFTAAVARLDETFRAATVKDDSGRLAELFGVGRIDLALRAWWWQRLPEPAPWPEAP